MNILKTMQRFNAQAERLYYLEEVRWGDDPVVLTVEVSRLIGNLKRFATIVLTVWISSLVFLCCRGQCFRVLKSLYPSGFWLSL